MYNNYKIELIENQDEYRKFLESNHYIKSLPRGCMYKFGLYIDNELFGLACYGIPVGKNVSGPCTFELKRFCLSPLAKKNTGSWLIAKCNKLIKSFGGTGVISYADPEQGHQGTLYKASNFKMLGLQKQGTPFVKLGERKVYYRNIENNKKLKSLYKKGIIKLERSKPKIIFYKEL